MKKARIITIILLILGIASGLSGFAITRSAGVEQQERPEKTIDDAIRDADYSYQSGRTDEALEYYKEAMAMDENNAAAMRGASLCMRMLGYNSDAEEMLKRIIATPDASQADYLTLVNLKIQLGDLEEARDLTEEGLSRFESVELKRLLSNESVQAPQFNIQSGEYAEYQCLELAKSDQYSIVHYTTDGSEPTVDSDVFKDRIILSEAENHIKAIAVSPLGYESEVTELTVSITKPQEAVISGYNSYSRLNYELMNYFNKSYGSTLYNYELAQIQEVTIVSGYWIDFGDGREDFSEMTFFPTYFKRYQSSSAERNYGENSDISTLQYCPFLRKVRICFQNSLDLSPLKGLQNIEELSLLNNSIDDISAIAGLKKLKKLSLGWNHVSDISALSGMEELVSLGLWDNDITDISPLENNAALEYLDIANNQVSDINALDDLTSLRELWINGNPVRDYSPVNNCRSLRKLIVGDADITVSDISAELRSRLVETDLKEN